MGHVKDRSILYENHFSISIYIYIYISVQALMEVEKKMGGPHECIENSWMSSFLMNGLCLNFRVSNY